MYGDCQVLSSTTTTMGGENNHHHHVMTTSDLLFSSPVRNPNFNFMSSLPFHPFSSIIPKEESNGGGLYIRSAGGNDELEQCMSGGSEPLDGGISGNEQDMAATTTTDLLLQGQYDPLQQQTAAAAAGDDGLITPTGPKKKRYHRHTARQIQEMEALFKENPHPDDKQRMRLSQELGLKPRQVKFWFQNRRTQMKAQQDRQDNVILRGENDNLKNDNYRLQAMMRSLVCNNCGGVSLTGDVAFDEQQLRLENARLKEELDRLCGIAARYSGRAMPSMGGFPAAPAFIPPSLDLDMSIYSRNFSESAAMSNFPPLHDHHHHQQHQMMSVPDQDNTPQFPLGGGALVLDEEKSLAMELAISSMDELVKMCQLDEPLWSRRNSGSNGTALDHAQVVLNVEEHARMFPWPPVVKQYNPECTGTRTEATRATALVIMNSLNLVDAFLDANKWMELFPSIVSRARTIQVVTSGVAGHASGSLHLMYGELQVVSPLVPARETLFLRYCHHNAEEGIWVVVDFPADNFFHGTAGASLLQPSSSPLLASTSSKYRRRPSGCIIQDMPNGYSRVTWVEHAEIVEEKPVHQIFNRYVSGGIAFGAQRWLAILQRQCERVASLMATNISDLGVIQSPEARKNLMKLAQRMIRTFCVNISTSGGQSWTALSESTQDTVRITTRKITEPGQPNGVILSAVTTTWLPFPHHQVFHLLKNERRRSQLEALSNGGSLHEVAHIANGSDPGNCISLLRMNVASNSSQNVELMLQESCTDSSGSLIVYTTVEVNYIQLVMSGEDPTCIPLLPLGFAIVPIGPNTPTTTACTGGTADGNGGIGGVGCLLTVGLQVHASTVPTAKLSLSSVTAINNHLCNAVHQINTALCTTTTGDNNTSNATPAIAIASHNSNNGGSNGDGNNNNDGAFGAAGVASDVAGSCPKPNASAPAATAASNQ